MAERVRSLSSIEDLRLVVAVADSGSVMAAAASLHVAQPSASQRLKALERRIGVTLFERQSTGARPTEAGIAYVERARQSLELAADAADAARAAHRISRVRLGTFVSLSVSVFTALDSLLGDDVLLDQRIDHGGRLVTDVAAGMLDGAVVAFPPGHVALRNTRRIRLGSDPLVVVAPEGRMRPRRSYRNEKIILASYSSQPGDDARRLGSRGAEVQLASSAPAALSIARQRGCLAVVPRTAWRCDQHDDERAVLAQPALPVALSLIVASRPHVVLAAIAPELSSALGLDP